MAKLEPQAPSDPIASIPPGAFDIKTIADLASEASSIALAPLFAPDEALGLPKHIPVAFINGKQPEVRSLAQLFEYYRLHPARKAGQAEALTLESFLELANRHKTAHSVIFANTDWTKPALTAVIDYHEAKSGGLADNCRHRVHYAYPLSEEWKEWIKLNGEPMKQAEFAYFLEDRVAELSAPTDHERVTLEQQFATKIATPAQVVELSRGLKVNVDTRVKTAVTLQSGEGQIAWEEAHNDATGQALKVPGLFMLSIAPFFMGDKIRLPVRLRYRPAGANITWSYALYRPDLAITEHVRQTLFEAREKTGLPVYEGKPEIGQG
ncbi:DUF2303 family protein [Mesorhizobium yinganensis]|uniref:DUF2303 family protein n=1 Tax=Mesorhizobium yinganensis TaxID=3157707 RepID=UPI0032B845D9